MRSHTQFDIGYTAGLFEGEGGIFRSASGRAINVKISMTDKEPLDRMQKLWGGKVAGPHQPREAHHKPYWVWQLSNTVEITELTDAIKTFLSPRRNAQIERVLKDHAPVRGGRGPMLPPGLQCPPVPIPSQIGYQRHRKLGIPACDICKKSIALWQAEYKRRKPESHKEMTLVCPDSPFPSEYPYTVHQRLGIPACAVCLESRRLYRRELKERHASST